MFVVPSLLLFLLLKCCILPFFSLCVLTFFLLCVLPSSFPLYKRPLSLPTKKLDNKSLFWCFSLN